MIRGFLFDLDGTLVNTHKANFEAYKKSIANFGVNIGWEEFKQTIGHQAKTFLPRLAPGLSDEEYVEIRKSKAGYYKEMLHLTEANKPLIDFMKTMAVNYPCVLVTTAQPDNAHSILKHHGLSDVFTAIITGGDVKEGKPNPEGYLLALKKLDLQPQETITFEDSETGRQAAEAAGIPVVMVKDFAV